ncbi:hypothetical protein PRIPAC_78811 [Pristionchus pacificus]|uniref:Uncharacterized protein n=1 Tax=Pristionchus pacificus TaxID=54126 RepID=A0A2A6BYC4_PRIPA|nr:hypothetical protein PRIPAC_78811 [Pristionchus pacificus]|eukprot:PDM70773.1 hypothetical protein PRIPAC_44977 [Pristionchus pacificus]
MGRFTIFGCHVTVIGIIFGSLNFIIFLLLLTGSFVEQGIISDNCTTGVLDQKWCDTALGLLIGTVCLTLIEICATGLLITAVLYDRGKLVIYPLIASYINIGIAVAFSILSILDACAGKKMGVYIMKLFIGRDEQPSKDAVLAASIVLCCLLAIAVVYCILNTIVHARIWQYYKRKREEEDWISETTSQISIIATFSMDMVYDEWRKKEDRTITSIAEEDENENEEPITGNKLEEIKEETEDLCNVKRHRPECRLSLSYRSTMSNHEIFGFHVPSVSIILVSINFVVSTLCAGATALVPLSLGVLLTVIVIAVVEICTCGIHIIAIREGVSRWLYPNLFMSAFNILLSIVLCVLSAIDLTTNRAMSTEVLLLISPDSFPATDSNDSGADPAEQISNSAPILITSILLSTLYVLVTLYNAAALHVHIRCYRFLAAAEAQFRDWDAESGTVSLFPELTEEYDDDWAKKPRSISSIKEEDEDDFYYRYLAE